MKLRDQISAVCMDPGLMTPGEIVGAVKTILEVEDMDSGMRDCIRACYRRGPLDDGDIPSKESRDKLVELGYLAKVVVRGSEGKNACTGLGAAAYRLIIGQSADGGEG